MALIVYELGGLKDRRYSSFSWRIRMALAHLGLDAEFRPVRVSDKQAIAFSGQAKVPILVDGDTVVYDSWRIAQHLEQQFGNAQRSLFGGAVGNGLTRMINAWADRQVLSGAAPLVACDLIEIVDEVDAAHLRAGMEKGFGTSLEQMREERESRAKAFRRTIDPMRAVLKAGQPFLAGEQPAYADYIVFSIFQWARILSTFDLLDAGDEPMHAWRGRMLALFDGLAEREPARAAAASA